MPKFSLIPREVKFYDMFEKASENLVNIAEELVELYNNYENVSVKVQHIVELEHEGDSITHTILEKLHNTFVTPFDSEDIARLTNFIDDMVDHVEAAANAMILYNVSKPTECSKKVTNIILDMARRLHKAMPLLRQRSNMKKILPECVTINRLENEADQYFRIAITDLFSVRNPDPLETMKWHEIYGILESATDLGEDVADVLERIVLKYAG